MILVLLGPPGSGKGTQAKVLTSQRGWPQLSTGDMLRAAIATGSRLGMEAKTFMDKGSLVPDSVVIGLIGERTLRPDCERGFILDGFPRTIPQAEALETMLKTRGRGVDKVLLFEIDDEELVRRLSGRRTCPKCSSMYHVENLKPKKDGVCDRCGTALILRDDDRADVIVNRLKVYQQQTAPLASYYEKLGRLSRIDAALPADEVSLRLSRAFVP